MFGDSRSNICLGDLASAGNNYHLTVHSGFSSKQVPFHDLVKTFVLPDLFLGKQIRNTCYMQLKIYVASVENAISLNDNNLRSKLSCLYFGNKAHPIIKPHAVEKNFGVLDKYFNIDSSNRDKFEKRLEEILDE